MLIPTAIRGIGGAAIFAVAIAGLYLWRGRTAIAMVVIGSGILGLVAFGPFGLTG